MKRGAIALLLLSILALAILSWGFLRPVGGSGHAQFVHVAPGTSLGVLAGELETKGLVRSGRALTLYGRLLGRSRDVKAGRYRLGPELAAPAILGRLVRGETQPIRVVFPEGLWMTEVASLLADSLDLSRADVLAAAREPERLTRYGIAAPSAEGYLCPDTYAFEGTETASSAVERLLATGAARWTDARATRARALGLTRHEVITLASIVEAETAVAGERAKVSAVYHRRLERGMMLQADPTIVYALGTRGRAPRYADLTLDSPYNTYRRKGLPPGPIGNPGEASIHAALYPDTTCTALFFVARADGSHIFTDTFDQHVAARKGLRR